MANNILSPDRIIMFGYLNHRGETSIRQVYIEDLSFEANPGYNYQPGWFLSGYDLDKKARRSFALARMIPPTEEGGRRNWASRSESIWTLFRFPRATP